MELLRKTQTAAVLLSLFVIFNLLILHTTDAQCRDLRVELGKPANITHPRQLIFSIIDKNNQIYLADLERAIVHILRYQFLKEPIFTGPKLIVLKNIMALLHYLNPLDTVEGKVYINNIYWYIQYKTEISHDDLKVTLNDSSLTDKSFKDNDYVGCRGTDAGMRDFNCSLWLLFHYFTVQAAKPPNCFRPGAVLWAFQGYVQHFMDCPECYLNLWLYAQQQQIEDVKTNDAEILWLWRAHNYFNKKLAGASNEDPFFPKEQFPPKKYCMSCRTLRGEWRSREVLRYLHKIYSLDKLYSFSLTK